MVVVAVAGGTGNIGRSVVEALLATKKHDIKILARKPNPTIEAEYGVPIIVVDYADIKSVAKTLEENNVHTLISTMTMLPLDGSTPKEIELIHAADASKTTKRMVSSDWGLPHTEDQIGTLPTVIEKLKAQAELKKTTDLEYTLFYCSYLMDYWGMPGVKSHMAPMTLVLDMDNAAAAIPGSGNTPVVFTHTTDVAMFVAASLDLDKWDTEFFVKGDRLTWNQFLHLAEKAKETKFKVTYDSVEQMKAGQTTELPGQIAGYKHFPKELYRSLAALFGLWFEQGVLDPKPERWLNDSLPDIRPMKVEEMLNKAWNKA